MGQFPNRDELLQTGEDEYINNIWGKGKVRGH